MKQKSGFTPSFLRYLCMIKVQHNINIVIVQVDNATVLINKATCTDLAQVGTVFKPSTVYTAYQHSITETSNHVGEARTQLMIVRTCKKPD
jgi:membrane peptidoglycan carboxypeptidase